MKSVLIVDDDVELCGMLRQYFEPQGMRVEARYNGCTGLHAALTERFDIVLLDVTMPCMEGLEVLRRLRRQGSDTKVVLLTALDTVRDRIAGLEHGADDYLAKPFNVQELLARVHAILRRGPYLPGARLSATVKSRLAVGNFIMDFVSRTVRYKSRKLAVTDIEFSLLEELLRSAGTVLSREDLAIRVLGRTFCPLDRSLDMHISRLRRKLEMVQDLESHIKTIRNAGYLLTLADS